MDILAALSVFHAFAVSHNTHAHTHTHTHTTNFKGRRKAKRSTATLVPWCVPRSGVQPLLRCGHRRAGGTCRGPGARSLTLEVHDLRKKGQQGCLPGCLFGGLQMLHPDNDCCCLAVITA